MCWSYLVRRLMAIKRRRCVSRNEENNNTFSNSFNLFRWSMRTTFARPSWSLFTFTPKRFNLICCVSTDVRSINAWSNEQMNKWTGWLLDRPSIRFRYFFLESTLSENCCAWSTFIFNYFAWIVWPFNHRQQARFFIEYCFNLAIDVAPVMMPRRHIYRSTFVERAENIVLCYWKP